MDSTQVSYVPVPPKVRTCRECKRKFADAESFRSHKYKFGMCRSEEALIASGYSHTEKGWARAKRKPGKDGISYVGL